MSDELSKYGIRFDAAVGENEMLVIEPDACFYVPHGKQLVETSNEKIESAWEDDKVRVTVSADVKINAIGSRGIHRIQFSKNENEP